MDKCDKMLFKEIRIMEKEEEIVKKMEAGDYLITGELLVIGLAEAIHLAGVTLGWSVSRCAFLLGVCVLVCGAGGLILLWLFKRRGAESQTNFPERGKAVSGAVKILYGVLALLFLSQLIFLCMGNNVYRGGDMMVETVGSFLSADAIYQVNPMTGRAYSMGIPSRLKILCLPTLYGSLCKWTGLAPDIVIWKGIPIVTLCSCYAAFGRLAHSLFPKDGEADPRGKRVVFMIVVSLLLWAGAYRNGMDGFNLLCCGWRGVTIRNVVLLPWLLSLILRRNWLPVVLCILAEACLVWTLYGCGVCLFVTAGLALLQLLCGRLWGNGKKRGKV